MLYMFKTFVSLLSGQASYTIMTIKFRPHRTRSAAADCGPCPLRNVTF